MIGFNCLNVVINGVVVIIKSWDVGVVMFGFYYWLVDLKLLNFFVCVLVIGNEVFIDGC